jgi:hypothetical protein
MGRPICSIGALSAEVRAGNLGWFYQFGSDTMSHLPPPATCHLLNPGLFTAQNDKENAEARGHLDCSLQTGGRSRCWHDNGIKAGTH